MNYVSQSEDYGNTIKVVCSFNTLILCLPSTNGKYTTNNEHPWKKCASKIKRFEDATLLFFL